MEAPAADPAFAALAAFWRFRFFSASAAAIALFVVTADVIVLVMEPAPWMIAATDSADIGEGAAAGVNQEDVLVGVVF